MDVFDNLFGAKDVLFGQLIDTVEEAEEAEYWDDEDSPSQVPDDKIVKTSSSVASLLFFD